MKVDGIDVRDIKQSSLRRNIGMIQQDVFMFAGTIRENIRYGRPDATDQEIVEAAVRAQVHKEIMELPQGYDSYIGERGRHALRGPEAADIHRPGVFEKPQDTHSGRGHLRPGHRHRAAHPGVPGRAEPGPHHHHHRPPALHREKCGHDSVVEGEHIIEMGTHKELMEKNGEYARLCRAQELK